jgi:hypothetical protein
MDSGTRAELRKLFQRGLLLRMAVAVALYFFTDELLFAPDQNTYRLVGEALARYWAGDILVYPSQLLAAGPKGYFYIVAVFYWVGTGVLAVQLFNCVLGALTILIVFDLARRMTGNVAIALRSAMLVAYFPSLILWSALNIRDAWIIMLIALICRQALVLQEKVSLTSLGLLAGAIWGLIQFRDYVLLAVTVPMVVSFLVRGRSHVGRKVFLGMVGSILVIYADQAAGTGRRVRLLDLEELQSIRQWNAYGAASQFEQADISTPEKALVFLPKGLAYFLLAPFPWMLGSTRQILTLPEMLLFYFLIPSILRGIRHLLRHYMGDALMVILVTAGLTFGYALGEGNAGTAYRHRAQLLAFYLMFAAVGIEVRRVSRAEAPTPAVPATAPDLSPRMGAQ